MNPLRAPMSSIYRLLVRMVMIGGFADTQAGLKGFQGEVGKKLFRLSRCTRFAIDVEVLYIALKHCLDIKRVPVHLRSDQHSSVRVVKDSLGMIRDLVRIKVNFERGLYDDDELLKVGLEHLQRPYPE
jgi:dolichyl-phosphate beta-glucosyltransferase